ncbi:MAG: response regulator transcription factor [Deltaproteobacteria bacterium]|nr:response regulator transcription factor [Deltaproteobacteria bacterium]
MIHIALADDHAVVREGFRVLLELEPDIEVVGEAGDGFEAVRLVHRTRPDVLLLDLAMPGIGGIEAARRIARTAPLTRVLFLTGCTDEIRVRQAFGVGAAGYMVKGASCARLVEAIRQVFEGRLYLCEPFAKKGIGAFLGGASSFSGPAELLTKREVEVLHLAVQGLTARKIAEQLAISPRTAEAHKSNLMRKLGLRCQTELVRFAISNGMVEINGEVRGVS